MNLAGYFVDFSSDGTIVASTIFITWKEQSTWNHSCCSWRRFILYLVYRYRWFMILIPYSIQLSTSSKVYSNSILSNPFSCEVCYHFYQVWSHQFNHHRHLHFNHQLKLDYLQYDSIVKGWIGFPSSDYELCYIEYDNIMSMQLLGAHLQKDDPANCDCKWCSKAWLVGS